MKGTSKLLGIAALFLSLQISVCQPASSRAQPGDGSHYSVTRRSAHSRTWERIEYEMSPGGVQVPRIHRYEEVATGLCYKNESGRFVDSVAEIEILENGGGAAASRGQHKVYFPPTLDGVIELNTPDGKWLRSRVLGLAYMDEDGRSVLIGETKSSVGVLQRKNTIVYPDAFEGVSASIRYTYTLGAFEQDVIIEEQLPAPEEFGLSENAKLQVLTEFIGAPEPKTEVREENGEDDVQMDWGVMKIGRGTAFSTGEEQNRDEGQPVLKRWEKLRDAENGNIERAFLIEEIRYKSVEPKLRELRKSRSAMNRPSSDSILYRVASKRLLPSPKVARKDTNVIQTAKADFSVGPGYVLDYTTVNSSQTDYRFQADTTYFVSGNVYLYGNTVCEGGTILKFDRGAALRISYSSGAPTLKLLTADFRPLVCTSKDDNSCGETISGSTGTPSGYYANPVLSFQGGVSANLNNLRITWAQQAIWFLGGTLNLTNAQFVNCYSGVAFNSGTAILRNVLFGNVQLPLDNLGYGSMDVQHATFSAATRLLTPVNQYMTVTIKNSILANVPSLSSGYIQPTGSYNGFYPSSSPQFGSSVTTTDVFPFQTVRGGNFYLISGSPFRDVGTSAIDANLLSELRRKTTYPPVMWQNVAIPATALGPQAHRDTTSGDAPDFGFHYDVLDYIFGGTDANENLTFAPGTAVGWYRTSSGYYHAGHGIHVADQKILTFDGRADAPCYWVRANTAQELNGSLTSGYGPGGITGWADQYQENPALSPEVRMRFTICSVLASEQGNHIRDDWGYITVRARDSEFHGGGIGGYVIGAYLTNCLMNRMYCAQVEGFNGNEFHLRNCTWTGGRIDFTAWRRAIPFSVKYCAFENTTINCQNYGENPANAGYSYNAFLTGAQTFPSACTGPGNVTVSSFNWQTGPRGNHYLPATATPSLVDAGTESASDVGLYHYTTQVNQAKEEDTTLDIGYHYLALNTSSEPVDTDGDGIPDYIEDTNGNGVYDPGADLSDWLPPSLSLVTIDAPDATASEIGPDTGTFTVTRAGGDQSGALTVNYTISTGTGQAVNGTDYEPLSGSVIIPAGQGISPPITVIPILDGNSSEGNETVVLTLASSGNYSVGTPNNAIVTIKDASVVTIATTDPTASEIGPDTGTYRVTRIGGDQSGVLTVNYTIGGSAVGTDYQTLSGSVTIPATVSYADVTLTPILDGNSSEGNETAVLTLAASGNYAVGNPNNATVTIKDASVVTIAATDPTASEYGPDAGLFTVTRSGGDQSGALTVYYAISGNAVNGTGYQLLSGSVTIQPTSPSATITLNPLNDGAVIWNATAILTLQNSTDYFVVNPAPSATVNIIDAYGDTDGDTLADAMEAVFGTNPLILQTTWRTDSDNDGLPDSYETLVGLNPASAESAPGSPDPDKCPL